MPAIVNPMLKTNNIYNNTTIYPLPLHLQKSLCLKKPEILH